MTILLPGRYAAENHVTERRNERHWVAPVEAGVAGGDDKLSVLAEQQAALRRVATLVAHGVSPSEVFSAVAEEMARCLHVGNATVLRYEDDWSVVVVGSCDPPGLEMLRVGERLTLEGDNVAVRVLRARRAVRMNMHDNMPGSASARIRELGLRCGVGTPIVVEGRVWGAAIVGSSAPEPLPPHTEARISDFADLVATAIAAATTRAELISSRARIVAAADEARHRLERDLHDGAQQRLVLLGLQLRMAEASVPQQLDDLRQQLSDIVSGLTGVSVDLHEISRGVLPAILSKGGLGPALKTLAHRSPVPVSVDVAIDRHLPDSAEVAGYYVVAEALTNIAKHAHASAAKVSAHADKDHLYLSIRDNGIGGADSHKGSGLVGLTDRVEGLGGHLRITSRPGSGTALDVTIPIDVDEPGICSVS
jgi:signal transduction histidine kinase